MNFNRKTSKQISRMSLGIAALSLTAIAVMIHTTYGAEVSFLAHHADEICNSGWVNFIISLLW